MGRNKYTIGQRTLYLFDITGMLISKFDTITEIANKTGCHYETINSALDRQSCFASKYYVSLNKDFKIPFKNSNFNPILSKQQKMSWDMSKSNLSTIFKRNVPFLEDIYYEYIL